MLPQLLKPMKSPSKYPEGMTVIIDTREQKPLFLPEVPKEPTIVGGLTFEGRVLPHGDYSLKGFEEYIGVERKRALEVYGWIGKERKKTEAKLESMGDMLWKGLVIEGTEEVLYSANKGRFSRYEEEHFITKVTPYQVKRSLAAFEVEYGIHIYYAENRSMMKRWILERFEFFYRKVRDGSIKL